MNGPMIGQNTIYIKLLILKSYQILTEDWQGIWFSYTKRIVPQITDLSEPNKRILEDFSPTDRDIKR